MRYTRSLISFVILTMLVGLGFLVLIANQAKAENECILTVTKVADPADDTVFTFLGTGDDNFSFELSDPTNPTSVGFISDGNTVTITEELPHGWILDKIECTELPNDCGDTPCLIITIDEETNSITGECLDDDEGSYTFFNVKLPINIPTLSEWGLIAMAGILGIVGYLVLRRRKVTA